MSDITLGYIFVPAEGTNRLTAQKLNRMGNGAVINPSFVSSKPAVSGPASGDQLIMLKADGTYARVPATSFGGSGGGIPEAPTDHQLYGRKDAAWSVVPAPGTGPPGPTGPAGENAFTVTSAGFTVPAVGATTTVTVADASWAQVNEVVYVLGAAGAGLAGALQITGISGNTLTLLNPTPAPAIPLADNTQSGLLRQVSGNVSDYVGGDNNCHVLPVAPPAGSGYWDSQKGLYWNDDFVYNAGSSPFYVTTIASGAAISNSTYGQDTTKKVLGAWDLATGTPGAANQGVSVFYGPNVVLGGCISYGLGALTAKVRMFFETTLAPTGASYIFRWGIAQFSGSNYVSGVTQQGFYFEWSPDNNSGLWRVAVGGATPTYTNTSVTAAADTAYNLEIDVNAAWTQITFMINGVTAATVTSGIPTSKGNLFMVNSRGATSTTSFLVALDSWLIYYPFSR